MAPPLQYVNKSNLFAMRGAIHDIGLAAVNASSIVNADGVAGVPTGSSKQGEVPYSTDLETGLPFWFVRNPKFLGYSDFEGNMSTGPSYSRIGAVRRMVWNYMCRLIWSAADAQFHEDDVLFLMRDLEAQFQAYETLQDDAGTPRCAQCYPHSMDWDYMDIEGSEYLYVEIWVAAAEVQWASSHPPPA